MYTKNLSNILNTLFILENIHNFLQFTYIIQWPLQMIQKKKLKLPFTARHESIETKLFFKIYHFVSHIKYQ